jgi:nicotinate-nucleotide pyrophosphorylase (carboxylating)
MATAHFVARQKLVVSGLEVARQVFWRLDSRCRFSRQVGEGQEVSKDGVLVRIQGPLLTLLQGERVALNFVRHLCGVATSTRRLVDLLRGTSCKLLDTRKTTPGFRVLEKAAVRAGGGNNHRMGLFDGVMIKDNHIARAGSIQKAVAKARAVVPPTLKIEVECETLAQVQKALRASADIIMLDNMPLEQMKQAVRIVNGRAQTEASGRIDEKSIRRVAACGVDFVSVGAITHSAPAVDVSMEMVSP